MLFGTWLMESVLKPRALKGRRLSAYLHKLMSDPELQFKISLLKSKKWKKQYQPDGQDLVPVYFYPDECDWAQLGLISNASGFSRCYIFVYLMLLDLGILKLPENRTKVEFPVNPNHSLIICRIKLDRIEKTLKRKIKHHLRRTQSCSSHGFAF